MTLSGNLTVDGATTISTAAATVLDDATVAAMVDTLGGASSVGSGSARATSPVFATQITNADRDRLWRADGYAGGG